MKTFEAPGLLLQENPRIYLTIISGEWLLKHCTPVWRIKDPEKGFQRVVKEKRARQIASAVLDQKRTFPNAIILATDLVDIVWQKGKLMLPHDSRFLVVDGQHRLRAQKYSDFSSFYACVIHCGLKEINMAKLFLEINDTQKRVPASLRWDLVRLVRPEDDQHAINAVDLVYELSTDFESPLHQKIDLTGEQSDITLNQGSIAPELKYIVSRKGAFKEADFETQFQVLVKYLAAIRSLDSSGWENGSSSFYQARVLRVLIRLLPEVINKIKKKEVEALSALDFLHYLRRIDKGSLSSDVIRAKQGKAGMKEMCDEIRKQIF